MNNKILYETICSQDYEFLTRIMIAAFNKDTSMHTDLKEGSPTGYNDRTLIKLLKENTYVNGSKSFVFEKQKC